MEVSRKEMKKEKILNTEGAMKHRFREELEKRGGSLEEVADTIGVTYQTLSKKMNEHVQFTRNELFLIKIKYNLSADDMDYIFFSF